MDLQLYLTNNFMIILTRNMRESGHVINAGVVFNFVIFRFTKILGILWLSEQLLAFQESLMILSVS